MNLPIKPPITPMLALLGDALPEGNYLYEPKWDGFRAVVFRDGDDIVIQSRHQRSLNRFFPDLVEGLKRQLPIRAVVDGEIVIAGERGLDFDALQLRLHPSTRRVTGAPGRVRRARAGQGRPALAAAAPAPRDAREGAVARRVARAPLAGHP